MTSEMQDAINTVNEFLNGTGSMWAWDDFLSVPPRDPQVTALQGFCRQLRSDYPPLSPREYCNEAGKAHLRSYVEELGKENRETP